MTHLLVRTVPLALALAVVAGCAGQPKLTPVSAARPGEPKLAVASSEGLKLSAEVDAWTGEEGVEDHVTPVLVTIENNSAEPVRLEYDSFVLTSPEGRAFRALAPYEVRGQITESARITGTDGFAPDFYHDGFWLDPAYGGLHPTIAPYRGYPAYDYGYYRSHYISWRKPLPTQRMLSLAVPERVLEPGDTISGFLYFEPVEEDVRTVSLRAELKSAEEKEEVVSRLAIPFRVRT